LILITLALIDSLQRFSFNLSRKLPDIPRIKQAVIFPISNMSKHYFPFYRLILCAILALSMSVSHAEIVTFGVQSGGENTWYDFGIRDDSVTGADGLDLEIVQDGMTFTLNVVSTVKDSELQLKGTDGDSSGLIPATSGNVWKGSHGTLLLTLSVTDPISLLDTIQVGQIDIDGWNGADEDMQFTALGSSVTKDATSGGVSGGQLSYDTLGIQQLSSTNLATWTLEIDMVDDGQVSGLGSISFDYTLGGAWAISTLSTGSVTQIPEGGSVLVDVSFDQAVTGLSIDDFEVLNGSIDSLSGSGLFYQLGVSPTSAAGNTLAVTLLQSTTTPQNIAAGPLELGIVAVSPAPFLTAVNSSVDVEDTVDVEVSFDLPVSGLSGGDFIVSRANVTDFNGYNNSYTLTLSPTGSAGEIINVNLPEGIADPGNQESNTLQIGITSDGIGQQGIQLSDIYSNDMVLQRDQILAITGTGFPGEIIRVEFRSQIETTTVDVDGNWLVHLAPEAAAPNADPLRISGTVSANAKSYSAYVGESWMCAGQSNMADSFENPPPAVEAEYLDWLNNGKFERFFFSSRGNGWKQIETDNRNVVSRTAFYFGMEIYKALNPDPDNIQIPVGIIISANGGTPIQSWMPAEDAEVIRNELGIDKSWNDWENKTYRDPGEQWLDKMDHIPPFGIRGVIWYQGERNAKSEMGYEYDLLLAHMVETWRRIWAERAGLQVTDFPFYFVEMSHRHDRSDYEFPWLRDRLRRAMDIIPNGKMGHFIDGGPDLHPHNKQLAGQRLALHARKEIYGETSLISHGPLLDAVTPVGNKLVLSFTEVNGGLRSLTDPSGGTLDFFEVAGSDGVYYDASAQIVGDTVEASSLDVPNPLHVRYLFLVAPTQPEPYYSLENVAGIPAATIISDDDFKPVGRTGGLTPAQYNDKQKAEALNYVFEFNEDSGNPHFRYSYRHDNTVDQVSVRFYMSDDLVTWVEVAASDVTYDGAPPSNTDEASYGNWIHSLSGSESDRYRDVVIQDPDAVESVGTRFYKIEVTP
jgi:sialate O-acetylesterase